MKSLLNYSKFKWVASAFVVVAVLFIGKDVMANYKFNHGHFKNESLLANTSYIAQPLDTMPHSGEVIRIQKQTNDKSVKLSMENGQITDLEVDGKKIDKADYDKYKDIIDEVKPRGGGYGNNRMFFYGDDDDNFGFANMKIFSDSLSKSIGDGFLQGFGSMDQILAEMSKHFDRFNANGMLDSMFMNLKNHQGQGFSFMFPNQKDGGIWIDKLDNENDANSLSKTSGKDADLTGILGTALNDDGMLLPNENNKVELTGKYLKINGERQPNNIFQKYKRILEEESGIELNKNSKLQFNIEGKIPKRRYRSF
jgi:hypothetical protein